MGQPIDAAAAGLSRELQRAAARWAAGDGDAPLRALAGRAVADGSLRGVVLVEGESDQIAIETLAAARGHVLHGLTVLPMGGSKSIRRFLELFGPPGLDLAVSGLYDAGEERDVIRGLERTGFGIDLQRADLRRHGFFVCVTDLEDELIRCLGTDAVMDAVAANGDLRSLQIVMRQPAQRDRTPDEVIHRFIGTRSGRKLAYARLLVDALRQDATPPPLADLLTHIETVSRMPRP